MSTARYSRINTLSLPFRTSLIQRTGNTYLSWGRLIKPFECEMSPSENQCGMGPVQSYAFIEEYWLYDHTVGDVLCRWGVAPTLIWVYSNMIMFKQKFVSKHAKTQMHLCECRNEKELIWCVEQRVWVWNSQGAVFYSHRSEWLWFADCRHIFYFSQKKRHVKNKKQLV